MMKKWLTAAVGTTLLLSGCLPSSLQQEEEVTQENPDESESQTVIIPNFQISDEYYKTLLPFEASPSRGMVVNNVYTNYDVAELESGLMRIAQQNFSPENYFFKSGQYLDSNTISSWLAREYTDEQLADLDLEPEENLGLNPVDDGSGDRAERAQDSPIYLAHILEHNYFVQSGESDSVSLGGVVIGLALNSVYYYQNDNDPFGPTFEEDIPAAEVEAAGKEMAATVLNRVRNIPELADVPVTIALFKQNPRSSVVPGNFISYASAPEGAGELGDWNNLNENYVLFPSSEATNNHREDEQAFLNFKQDVEDYFPNFNSVVGTAMYQGDQLTKLNIDIPLQYYGKSEIVGFTQFVAGRLIEIFPEYFEIEVSITSLNGPEALIVKEENDTEPFVHIYAQ